MAHTIPLYNFFLHIEQIHKSHLSASFSFPSTGKAHIPAGGEADAGADSSSVSAGTGAGGALVVRWWWRWW